MAKDPAMLWYWNDWNSGTILFSRFLKGCYMDLLHAQFNNGRLSLEEIKTCLGSDFGQSWPTLQKKFKQDEKGLFFNERLEREKIKRQNYSESRRRNKEGKSTHDPTHDSHMLPHMENENRNENVLEGVQGENWNTRPGKDQMGLELPEIKVGSLVQLMKLTRKIEITPKQVKALWEVFKAQKFDGNEFYQSKAKVFSHFSNWANKQEIKPDEKLSGDNRLPSGPVYQNLLNQ